MMHSGSRICSTFLLRPCLLHLASCFSALALLFAPRSPLSALQIFLHVRNHLPDIDDLPLASTTLFDLHLAVGHIPFPHNDLQGHAQQIGVLEFEARGYVTSIIVQHVHELFVQLLVETFSNLECAFDVGIHENQVNMERSNNLAPYDAVIVMTLLNMASNHALHADAIAAHDDRLLLSVFS